MLKAKKFASFAKTLGHCVCKKGLFFSVMVAYMCFYIQQGLEQILNMVFMDWVITI